MVPPKILKITCIDAKAIRKGFQSDGIPLPPPKAVSVNFGRVDLEQESRSPPLPEADSAPLSGDGSNPLSGDGSTSRGGPGSQGTGSTDQSSGVG